MYLPHSRPKDNCLGRIRALVKEWRRPKDKCWVGGGDKKSSCQRVIHVPYLSPLFHCVTTSKDIRGILFPGNLSYITHLDTHGNIFTFLSFLQNSGGRSGLTHGFSWFVSWSEVVPHDIVWAISLVLYTAWVMNNFADNFYF